ncbi:peptidoglycan-binding domain-containing protein [Pseudomonas sp. SA3-5]|uniref:Peptidoglycan-binding domain-containing protein n=1 Tax=Pseudomonas aestuarii TaxID=3018340 RepID=A0ABT4XJP8_9PSED|nr:peptidoglycan-binding domain-containing protein [Pseudomonas aestuarii]MDA7088449.1 peptidoglycan-binding domain-containing protein [Pseudomonas aestuarii]
MLDFRNASMYAALLFGFSISPVTSGLALAQSGMWEYSVVPGLQLAQAFSSTVQEVQRELNRRGYSAGPSDGLMGARTRAAIQAYQSEHDLLVDGQATSALLAHLRTSAQSRTPAAQPEAEASSQPVAEIQEALRSLGYTVGRPSARLTDETRAAIRRYESDHGLLMSGEPSTELLRHMRGRVDGASSTAKVDANTVARIQTELRLRGYPIPLVSGQMDAQTRQAIREYQQGRGVPATGEPSQTLLDELRVASAEQAPSAPLTLAQRAAAQRALSARGYDAGPPDGVLGPRSRIAIQKFQTSNNLSPTGELTPPTLELLGLGTAVAEPPQVAVRPYRTRVQDDFADGDYVRNPAWHITSGRFEVRNGGLNSWVNPPSARAEDRGQQQLSDLLKEQFGISLPGQAKQAKQSEQARAAAAYLPTQISQEFQITMVLSGSAEAHSHIDLGPYQGDNLNHGYRLNYRANQPRPLQLLFVNEKGESAIASAKLKFDNGGPHQLVWQRDAEGRMMVSEDGKTLIDVVDRSLIGDLNGFSLINAGGAWTLQELIVEDRR